MENELDRQLRDYRETELEHIHKEASKLREVATDVNEALNEVENYLATLQNLQIEVRSNSIPFITSCSNLLLWPIRLRKEMENLPVVFVLL